MVKIMKCLKHNSRTLFNLLDIFDCNRCKYRNDDYYFYIGNNVIWVYYLNKCHLQEEVDIFNMKILYILRLVIETDDIFFWVDSYDELELILGDVISLNKDVVIVIDK